MMYFGEINIGIRLWFARRVRQGLEAMRVYEGNSWERRQQLADPEILEWTIEWFCEHIADFIQDDPRDTFCVDDIHNDERVTYRHKAVCKKCWDVLDMAIGAREGPREAQRFADLDSWLKALHTGQLEWGGPTEKDGEDFVEDDQVFGRAARKRRVRWPRVCRTCGEEFRIEKGTAKNCPDCRAKRQAKRRAVGGC